MRPAVLSCVLALSLWAGVWDRTLSADDVAALVVTGVDGPIEEGQMFRLVATATMQSGERVEVGARGVWSVDNTEILDGDHRGFLSTRPGTAVVTCRYGGRAAVLAITVHERGRTPPHPAPPIAELVIERDAQPVRPGQVFQCRGRYAASGAAPRTVTLAGRWSSTPPDVLKVGVGGEFLALAAGTAVVVLEFRSSTAETTITVLEDTPAPPVPAPPVPAPIGSSPKERDQS